MRFSRHFTAFSLLFLGFLAPIRAQVAAIPFAPPQYLDSNGHPLAGGRLASFQAGTSTGLATYCDALGTITNPTIIILNAAGRPGGGTSANNCGVFLGSNAYKFVLQDSLGRIIWTIDNITANNLSLLASANVWTGTNRWVNTSTFDGPVSFTVGFTSSGPSTLNGGGSINGSWSGNPTFSGTPNFAAGFTATTGTFSGQIISTLATGTAPLVVASTTQVANLNASQLEGCDWAAPCPIGTTTPNTAIFTGLQANTQFQLGLAGTPVTAMQGTDTHLLSAGTVAGTGATLCTDAQGGATTSGCLSLPSQIQAVTYCASGCTVTGTPCTTGSSSFDTCDNSITWPSTWATANYAVTCSGVGPVDGGNPTTGRANLQIASQSTLTVTVRSVTLGSSAISWGRINCTGMRQ